MAPGLQGRHREPLHKEGQLSGRNCSKQQHLASWLGETGAFPPSLPGSGLGNGKFQSWVVRTQLHLLLIPPGLTWRRRACSQPGSAHGYQVATPWGESGSKSSSLYSSAPFLYKPLLPTQHQGLARLSASSQTTTKDLPLNTPLRTRMLWDRTPTSHGITRFRMMSTGEDSFGLNTNTPGQEQTMQENHAENEL